MDVGEGLLFSDNLCCITCLSFFSSVIHLQKAGPGPDVEFGRRAPSTLVVETCHYTVSKIGR